MSQKNTSQAEHAYQQLRTEILECQLMPGTRLTESLTLERLALGKTPVREALQRLINDNLMVVIPRHGYEVAPISLRDVEEVFGLRAIIEPQAVVMAIGRLEPKTFKHLHKLAKTGYDLQNPKSIQAFQQANTEFHSIIAKASGNRRLAAIVEQCLAESRRLIQFGMLIQPRSEEATHEHEDLLEALEQKDQQAVLSIAKRQIEASKQMVLQSLLSSRVVQEAAIQINQKN
jgi:DNA-binding GntR family transcriptional regulator